MNREQALKQFQNEVMRANKATVLNTDVTLIHAVSDLFDQLQELNSKINALKEKPKEEIQVKRKPGRPKLTKEEVVENQ